jgi:hypothetical protein
MSRRLLAAALVGAIAAPAWAENQNGLTPTDILEAKEVTATVRLSADLGQGKLSSPSLDLDSKSTTFQARLAAAVGLGVGFEIEIDIPYQFSGVTKGDGRYLLLDAETKDQQTGFGDLTLVVNHRLLKESATQPMWIAGALVVMPSGNDKRGTTEWKVNGSTIQGGDRGGIGEGVWSYGFQTAVSKRFGIVEPYGDFRYVIGGRRTRNGVTENRADVGSLLLGAEVHATPKVTIDGRTQIDFFGKDKSEFAGMKITEASHVQYGFHATAYVDLAKSVTLLAGIGATRIEDHGLYKEYQTTLKNAFDVVFLIGLHFNVEP